MEHKEGVAYYLGDVSAPGIRIDFDAFLYLGQMAEHGAEITVVPVVEVLPVVRPVLLRPGGEDARHLLELGEGEQFHADLTVYSRAGNKRLFRLVRKHLPFDQLVWEKGGKDGPDWVHVSYNARHNRHQIIQP